MNGWTDRYKCNHPLLQDEGTFSLKDDARNAIAKLDSQLISKSKPVFYDVIMMSLQRQLNGDIRGHLLPSKARGVSEKTSDEVCPFLFGGLLLIYM